MSVALVVVSHSGKVADGICDLAAQMAADVDLIAAGGTDDGGIGTSLARVQAAVETADCGDGVVILTDLGSAVMTAETALEFLDDDQRSRVQMANAPIVEGAIAAAVAAQTGNDVDGVRAAAEASFTPAEQAPAEQAPAEQAPAGGTQPESAAEFAAGREGDGVVSGEFELINPMGLHARPAAVLAQELTELDAEVSINGVDGKSVMLLMTLGAAAGHTLTVRATGADAAKAVDLIRTHVHQGFGEI